MCLGDAGGKECKVIMKKKVVLIFLAMVFVFGGFYLWYYMSSNHNFHYSSVNQFIKENGSEYFIDMYDPHSYFDIGAKKEKLTEINKLNIYYQNDPHDIYFITFYDVFDQVNLDMHFCNNGETDEALDDYIMHDYEDYQIYIYEKEDIPRLIGKNKDYLIYIEYENYPNNQDKINKLKEKAVQMLKDTFSINQ